MFVSTMGWTCGWNGQSRNVYIIFMRNSLGIQRIWKYNIGIDINPLCVMRMVDGTRLKMCTGSQRHWLC
jgi:hypothetical protein